MTRLLNTAHHSQRIRTGLQTSPVMMAFHPEIILTTFVVLMCEENAVKVFEAVL